MYVRDTRAIDELSKSNQQVTDRLSRELQGAEEGLAAGDSLPNVTLRAEDGRVIHLADIGPRFRYLYFGRANCPACTVLDSAWVAVPKTRRDSVLMIDYHPDSNVTISPGSGHLAWVHDSANGRLVVTHVPTLVVLDGHSRVLSATHGSVLKVATTLQMYGIMSRPHVDTLLARFGARAAGTPPVAVARDE
jgi:hypothetical protein